MGAKGSKQKKDKKSKSSGKRSTLKVDDNLNDPNSISREKETAHMVSVIGRSESRKQAVESESKSGRRSSIGYTAQRVLGRGAFAVVYQAVVNETGEVVAIKRVLQDRRYKNRELDIMKMLKHPCVVALKHHFNEVDKSANNDTYLNLVMECFNSSLDRCLRHNYKQSRRLHIILVKTYMFQILRAVAYTHSLDVCHRDIKPQNLLLDPEGHVCKLCDFGSAKVLQKGYQNIAYICSRYYRAPELCFQAREYTTAIDIWSVGCVLGEMLLGRPLFRGRTSDDQLSEIMKVLGTPTSQHLGAMNPNYRALKLDLPSMKPTSWQQVLPRDTPEDCIDLISNLLKYEPDKRLTAFDALVHPFFDDIKKQNVKLPHGKELPDMFSFTEAELAEARKRNLYDRLVPDHLKSKA